MEVLSSVVRRLPAVTCHRGLKPPSRIAQNRTDVDNEKNHSSLCCTPRFMFPSEWNRDVK